MSILLFLSKSVAARSYNGCHEGTCAGTGDNHRAEFLLDQGFQHTKMKVPQRSTPAELYILVKL
jgi:hypothetical protein